MSVCSDSAAPWTVDGSRVVLHNPPMDTSQSCSFALALSTEPGLSAVHREALDSHIPQHPALSPPQVQHHVLLIWSSHSSTPHTSAQSPRQSPTLCGAQWFPGDAEPPLPPACLKMGNAQPRPRLNLYLLFFSNTPDTAILMWQKPWWKQLL